MGNSMSFSVTPAEGAQVEAFKQFGATLEPRQGANLIMVIVISVAYVFRFASLLFMLWHRKYPPIKAKNLIIMSLVFATSIFWFVGDIQMNNHAPLKGSSMTECKAIGVWMHIVLGVCAVSALIELRSYGLYQVFCLNRPYRGPPLYISVVGTSLFLLTFGIIVSALPGHITVMYAEPFDMCTMTDGYKAAVLAIIWVTWLVVAWFNWHIRNIKSSFNEVREVTIAGVVVFSILTFTTVLAYAMPKYPLNVKVRVVSTSLGHIATALIWWMTMSVPLYMCLTDREGYLKRWIQKLRQDSLQRAYHVDSGAQQSQHLSESDRHQFIHMAGLNKDLEFANANGEFFYTPNENVCAEKAVTQICPAPDSRDYNSGVRRNSSVSSLVARPLSPTAIRSGGVNPAVLNTKKSADANNVHRIQPPQPATRRTWDKLASAVSSIGGSAFASNSNQPGDSSPVSAPISSQMYTPIINFAETAARSPLPPNSAQGAHHNDKYNINGRQIL
ncbi:hypothetical protein IW146_006045 [Coemansia sp. RSA 922]|nr:hypothetical protein H4S03_006056 [Coemansia sp. S3946]KAJ2068389.1 hypothetical protein GGH13_004936 [Coemansia sp. S155-1]KAJ2110132.1 hypothetical protein IW146_006045 [Coemansia sp. RSA 922]